MTALCEGSLCRMLAHAVFGVALVAMGCIGSQVWATSPSYIFEEGCLGAELKTLPEQFVKAHGLAQSQALLVVRPTSGGPAERDGLRSGDVILEIEGGPVGAVDSFESAIRLMGLGRTVTIGLLRGTERFRVQVTLGGNRAKNCGF